MQRFEEGALAFEFDEQWQVIPLDRHRDYLNKLQTVDGSKAVDFLGILRKENLYFIEVKDFRGYRIENKDRLEKGGLALEIAQKVRDSVACIISAYRTSSEPEIWQAYANLLLKQRPPIKIVIWLEEDVPVHQSSRLKHRSLTQAELCKRSLAWLTKRVFVCRQGNQSDFLPNVAVRNLPNPPQSS